MFSILGIRVWDAEQDNMQSQLGTQCKPFFPADNTEFCGKNAEFILVCKQRILVFVDFLILKFPNSESNFTSTGLEAHRVADVFSERVFSERKDPQNTLFCRKT